MGIVIFSILFGLDCIATVPPTVAPVADAFGRHDVRIVYGRVHAAHQASVAAGLIAMIAGSAALAIRRRTTADDAVPVGAA